MAIDPRYAPTTHMRAVDGHAAAGGGIKREPPETRPRILETRRRPRSKEIIARVDTRSELIYPAHFFRAPKPGKPRVSAAPARPTKSPTDAGIFRAVEDNGQRRRRTIKRWMRAIVAAFALGMMSALPTEDLESLSQRISTTAVLARAELDRAAAQLFFTLIE